MPLSSLLTLALPAPVKRLLGELEGLRIED
jgi:hypothetical protein